MKEGDIIKVNNEECFILDVEYPSINGKTGILCICKNVIHTMLMYADRCEAEEGYENSGIAKYLDELSKKWQEAGVKFLPMAIKMTALDGTGWEKDPYIAKGLCLPSMDIYRKYRRYIDRSGYNDWHWLSTKLTYSRSASFSYATSFCRVHTDGGASYSNAHYSYGVAPAFLLKELPTNKVKIGEVKSGLVNHKNNWHNKVEAWMPLPKPYRTESEIPCKDYVSRPPMKQEPCEEDIAEAFQLGLAFGFGKRYDEMDSVIDEIKKVVTPRQKTGYWVRWYESKENDLGIDYIPHCKCSKCGQEYDPHSSKFINYCFNCGAKMLEVEG